MREMPTGAKLVAGFGFAAVGFAAAVLFEPILTEVQRGQWFTLANAALGFAVGWRVMGRMVGRDYRAASRAGVGTSVWLLFWALLAFSSREMILRSLDKRYRSPTDALTNMLDIGFFYLKLTLRVEVIGALLLGGIMAGLLAELANRHWR